MANPDFQFLIMLAVISAGLFAVIVLLHVVECRDESQRRIARRLRP